MKKKSKIILTILLLLIIILSILELHLYLGLQHKPQLENELEKFEPFSKNNVLIKYNTNLNITENLPKIEAASAFYPLAANIVQNTYNESGFSNELLEMVSTSQAFEDIINGKTDIIIATAPSDEQRKMINEANIKLEFKEIYIEPLVVLVNKNNNINNLEVNQIKKMYYSPNPNWNEYGTNIGNVHTYQLEKNNGSQTCFESIVKNNKIGENHYEIHTMPDIIDKIAEDENGIGYAFYSYYSKMHVNDNVKVITVDNKRLSEEDYPLLFDIYMVYRNDNNNENIGKIAQFLETEVGKEFISNTFRDNH